MGKPPEKRPIRNAGAFLTDTSFGMIPVPMSTLSDEWHDEPPEPEDSDRVPEVEPPGQARQILDRLTRRGPRSEP